MISHNHVIIYEYTYSSWTLTKAGVRGAIIAPILPIVEEKANKLCLYFVGNNSDVYKTVVIIAIAMLYLPKTYTTRDNEFMPEKLKEVK